MHPMVVAAAGNNFLLPNGTFFAELIAFGIILAIIWRFVVGPIQKVMAERQELIREQAREARAARERMEAAEADYRRLLDEARAEASRIREEARAEGQRIIDEARANAQAESDRVIAEGRGQLAVERDSLVDEIRGSIGTLALDLAGRIVGEPIGEEAEWRPTVEPYLAGIRTVDGRLRATHAPESPEQRPVASGGRA